ncbi:hypothetical protein BH10PSE13_BH10PSE13_05920 [soil metagenome]
MSISRRTRLCSSVSGVVLLAVPTSGWCQGQAAGQGPEAPPQAGATVDADANLGTGEILVTARRRAERLQDVPVAVTGASLAQANIVQVQDIQQKAPGMSVQSSSFGSNVLQISIRGQRQFDPYITKDPAVAVYFADVVQNRPQGLTPRCSTWSPCRS